MSNDSTIIPLAYTYKGKPLQHRKFNDYTKEEKLEIIIQLNNEFQNGLLSVNQMVWIWERECWGSFSVELFIDKLLEKGVIKKNPITNDTRTFRKPKTIFDW